MNYTVFGYRWHDGAVPGAVHYDWRIVAPDGQSYSLPSIDSGAWLTRYELYYAPAQVRAFIKRMSSEPAYRNLCGVGIGQSGRWYQWVGPDRFDWVPE